MIIVIIMMMIVIIDIASFLFESRVKLGWIKSNRLQLFDSLRLKHGLLKSHGWIHTQIF